MNDKTIIKTPGKLMIAGEYAVLEAYHTLIVTAVNRFIYTTIENSNEHEVNLLDYNLYRLRWTLTGNYVEFNRRDKRLRFIKAAMETVFQYIREQGIQTHPISLTIKSELIDKSGIKYGLGSSAAVVTSVVEAILTKFLPQTPKKLLIFKLAAIAHVKVQGSGSGADIAASTYTGLLRYTSFQSEWLLEKLDTIKDIKSIIKMEWTYLSIERLDFPPSINMIVAWTGSAASTKHLVAEIKAMKSENPVAYEHFLQKSEQAVNWIIQGIKGNEPATIFKGINKNRLALRELGNIAGVPIETEQLSKLSKIAEKNGDGAGKLSGAGGGDCGIIFLSSESSNEHIRQKLLQEKIIPLELNVYDSTEVIN